MSIAFNLIWRYASYHNRLLGKNVDQRAVAAISWQYLFGPTTYTITLALTWISVPASLILNFALALFFAVPARLPRKLSVSDASTDLDASEN